VKGLIGRKIGMTQYFNKDSKLIPTTVIEAGPCVVLAYEKKTEKKHSKLLLGFEKAKYPKNKNNEKKDIKRKNLKGKRLNKPLMGIFDKLGLEPYSELQEFRIDINTDLKVGDILKANDVFKENGFVDIRGKSKGKGFAGVIKRHNFHGGKMSHGSMFKRAPGSIGQGTTPGRVIKGHPLPGQYGNKFLTIQNLKIIKIIPEKNIILIKGSIPGPNGSYIRICESMKKTNGREYGK